MCHAGNANFVVVLKTKHKFQTSMKNTEKFKDSLAKLSFTGKKRERKRKKEEEEEEERLYGEKKRVTKWRITRRVSSFFFFFMRFLLPS